MDRYESNFTIRFKTEELEKLKACSEKIGKRKTTIIRRALKEYYEALDSKNELLLIKSTPFNNLNAIIPRLKTNMGKEEVLSRIVKGK